MLPQIDMIDLAVDRGILCRIDKGRGLPAAGYRRHSGFDTGFLNDKRDLGIHTEMFSGGVVDLVDNGVL